MERLDLSFTGFSGNIKLHFVVNNREKEVLIAKTLPELLGATRFVFTIAPHFSSSAAALASLRPISLPPGYLPRPASSLSQSFCMQILDLLLEDYVTLDKLLHLSVLQFIYL